MAATVRTMTLGQNIHNMIPQNCVIVSNMLPAPQMYHSHGKRPIAPAIEPRNQTVLSSNSINHAVNIKPKQKYNYGSMPYPNNQTASVQRRNARERNRVKQVNNGFSNLRQHIPQHIVTQLTKGGRGSSKKLSKVDTLKLAVEYIRKLKDMLDDNENNDAVSTSTGCSQSYYSDNSHMQSIPRSEASLSPTHSYSSDSSSTLSYTPNHIPHGQQQFKMEPFDSYVESSTSPAPSYHSDVMPVNMQHYPHSSTPYTPKENHYNPYNTTAADDEDLLDAISWWQQQQD